MAIDEETVKILKQHHTRQAAEKLHVGEDWKGTEDGYVFALT